MSTRYEKSQKWGPVARTMVVISALLLLTAPLALAQSSGSGSGQGQSGPGSGNASVSDSELESFVAALQDVQSIRQSMAQETQQAVSDSELSQQRFEELYRSEQGGSEPGEAATETESQQFDQLMSQIQQIQQQSNQEMVQAVKDEGLTVSRFNQIAQAIQQNPELQQEFRQMRSGGTGS